MTIYAGKDATRGLAKMSLSCATDDPDDLSDLTKEEWDSVKNWENKFQGQNEDVKFRKPTAGSLNISSVSVNHL